MGGELESLVVVFQGTFVIGVVGDRVILVGGKVGDGVVVVSGGD